jgi:hypothetical protein
MTLINAERRIFTLRQAAGELRTAQFESRQHLIVPVVALMEGVIQAANSDEPEFVPAEVLAQFAAAWNGEPVLWDHPIVGGERVSANDPRVLEAYMTGRLFNAQMKGTKLSPEAWLDLERCAAMGGHAQDLVDRVNAGELIEVSVGAFVKALAERGVHKGKRYSRRWTELAPDHLAMLPAGTQGACSAEMGCGAPRAAAARAVDRSAWGPLHVLSADGLLMAADEHTEDAVKLGNADRGAGTFETLAERFKGAVSFFFRNAQSDGELSDAELRAALDAALFSTVPGFLGIEAVFASDSTVIYAVAPDGDVQWYSREYSLSDSGAIELAGDETEVKPVTRFEPVTAAGACGCDPQGEIDMDKATRIAALIACDRTPFTESDRAGLELLSIESLESLEAPAEEPVVEPVTPAVEEPVEEPVQAAAGEPAELSDEEWMSKAPAKIRAALQRQLDAEAAEHALHVTALEAAQDVYDREALEAKTIEELKDLTKLCTAAGKVEAQPDFSGKGLPRQSSVAKDEVPAPPSLTAGIRAAAGKGESVN